MECWGPAGFSARHGGSHLAGRAGRVPRGLGDFLQPEQLCAHCTLQQLDGRRARIRRRRRGVPWGEHRKLTCDGEKIL
jgi:hypothetical protein